MKNHLVILIMTTVVFSACLFEDNDKATYYYPLKHFTPIYHTNGDSIDYAHWGEALLPSDLEIESIDSNQAFVERILNGYEGVIDLNSVCTNVVSAGVILKETIGYNTPSLSYSDDKIEITPPALAYIVEIKNGEWANVKVYSPDSIYSFNRERLIYPDNFWIKLDQISLKQKDIDVIVGVQLTLAAYQEIMKMRESERAPLLETQKRFLENDLIRDNLTSSAIDYAEEALDLLNHPIPRPTTIPNNTNKITTNERPDSPATNNIVRDTINQFFDDINSTTKDE